MYVIQMRRTRARLVENCLCLQNMQILEIKLLYTYTLNYRLKCITRYYIICVLFYIREKLYGARYNLLRIIRIRFETTVYSRLCIFKRMYIYIYRERDVLKNNNLFSI